MNGPASTGALAGVLRLDGATATELQRRGISVCAPWWTSAALGTARGRAVLGAVHAEYAAAGAQIVTANTFRCNLRAMRRAGLDRAGAARLVRLAVGLARTATVSRTADPVRLVAGSMAPVEDCYRPDRVPDTSELRAEHDWLARQLVAAGVDLVLVETMNCLREARVALERALTAGARVFVSFVVGEGGRLLSGEPIRSAVRAVERDGAAAVLVNCAVPPWTETSLRLMSAVADGPVGAYPNVEDRTGIAARAGHVNRPLPASVSADAFAETALRWCRELGAGLVGGCCGSTPGHLAALRKAMCPPGSTTSKIDSRLRAQEAATHTEPEGG